MQQLIGVSLDNDCLFCGLDCGTPEAVEQHELRCSKKED